MQSLVGLYIGLVGPFLAFLPLSPCVESLRICPRGRCPGNWRPGFLTADVVVIGGGHSGCEAATASARVGANTILVTPRASTIGEMSCNPSIGGIGKGNIVCEVDALDGIMARAADEGGIMFHLLNRSKGPAVQGPRAQQDRNFYASAVRKLIAEHQNLTIHEAMVHDLVLEDDKSIVGLVTSEGLEIKCNAVVVTTGTFQRGRCHISKVQFSGGRRDRFKNDFEPASDGLAATFKRLDIKTGRFKTGTPPRLVKASINFDGLEVKNSDEYPFAFSQLNAPRGPPLRHGTISCYKTRTNERVHEIVRQHLHALPDYESGLGQGLGPRYCPSIASKVLRFPHHPFHIVWLEPEGIDSDLIYPNGLSGAFPESVQLEFLRAIKGLENVEIATPGYDVEYDYIDPRQLDHRLNFKGVDGLFFAGQVCGTTGYEEAAGLGIVAGANAGLHAMQNGKEFILNRSDGYIGVLVDDLVTKGTFEPYRMFTSRAEDRLVTRMDNADLRMVSKGVESGLIRDFQRLDLMREKYAKVQAIVNVLRGHRMPLSKWTANKVDSSEHKNAWQVFHMGACTLDDLLDVIKRESGDVKFSDSCKLAKLSSVELRGLNVIFGDIGKLLESSKAVEINELIARVPNYIAASVVSQNKYGPLINRHSRWMQQIHRGAPIPIAADVKYSRDEFAFLSAEEVEVLNCHRPTTIQQMATLPGITPCSLLLLAAHMSRHKD